MMIKTIFEGEKPVHMEATPEEEAAILELCRRGGANPMGVTVTHAGAIWSYDVEPDDATLAHERVHLKQQAVYPGTLEEYTDRYFADAAFRLKTEAEAFAAEYRYLCTTTADKNARYSLLVRLAAKLSSPLYGNLCSAHFAERLIKSS